MDVEAIVGRLETNARVLSAQVAGVDERQARWKPEPNAWSIVEVVAHLADEERRDFRTRLDLTLNAPGTPWPAIDPERWAIDERYLDRDLASETARFVEECATSVAWLRALDDPDWTLTYDHPRLGTMRAGELLASWLAHDLIHVRQLNRLHRQYLDAVLAPDERLGYAGPW